MSFYTPSFRIEVPLASKNIKLYDDVDPWITVLRATLRNESAQRWANFVVVF